MIYFFNEFSLVWIKNILPKVYDTSTLNSNSFFVRKYYNFLLQFFITWTFNFVLFISKLWACHFNFSQTLLLHFVGSILSILANKYHSLFCQGLMDPCCHNMHTYLQIDRKHRKRKSSEQKNNEKMHLTKLVFSERKEE